MTLQSIRRPILLLPGVLLVLIWVAARGQAPAPLSIPTLPGVGFAIIGIAPGETALRLNALNSGPVVPVQDPAGCQVTLQFHDSEGQMVKERVIPGLPPGAATFLDLSRDELPRRWGGGPRGFGPFCISATLGCQSRSRDPSPFQLQHPAERGGFRQRDCTRAFSSTLSTMEAGITKTP